ncbi:ATP-binding protein [Streptomyces sp. NBC_00872]|uniref:sensor histidine kinase n=1 Tax=Streptomyces sp. NBC_00872 TaxID=2903686 RepID=UPI003866768D|nr:HAMP domain-containing histidine kinase [Streptomyces sp. NBC_00872]
MSRAGRPLRTKRPGAEHPGAGRLLPARLLRRTGRPHRTRSLRTKLTLVNVLLLALGITVATAVSLFGLRHYLLGAIDSELTGSRDALRRSGITMKQIESLSALAAVRDVLAPGDSGASTLPRPETVFVSVAPSGRAVFFAGIGPSARQRALAEAVTDPKAAARFTTARDVDVDGEPYRMTAAELRDGTVVLLAKSTKTVHQSLKAALKLDLAFGTLLLVLLAVMTLMGAGRTLRPLKDMVETASAIAEGDLTRRIPGRHDTIAETEQLRLALNSMLQQVESAYVTRERSAAQLRRFVADASHELRTPLAAIRGYLQLYDRGMLREPAERTRAMSRMNAEADRMSRLVDELLTLARLDQRPELRLRPVDMSRLVRDAADDLRAQQPDRTVEVAAAGTMLVQGDEPGLRQVIGNLLTNIRVHTPEAAPVTVELTRSECGEVRLRVADRGPGMEEADADRIFDRFFRVTGATGTGTGMGTGGSGLGMSIVQAVVASHGGEVTVETAPGAGLAVTVTLPRPSP